MPHDYEASTTPYPRGSEWRMWDLHVHTPFSYRWKGGKLTIQSSQAEKDAQFAHMLSALNGSAVAVFATMDYWTFDGFIEFRSYIKRTGQTLRPTLFPGIELRLESPMKPRLNAHVLLSDHLTDDQLRSFQSMLQISIPEKRAVDQPVCASTFIRYARSLDAGKIKQCGKTHTAVLASDEDAAFVGMETAKVTRSSLVAAVEAQPMHALLLLAWDTYGGLKRLDWKDHAHDDAILCKQAQLFEARNAEDVATILGVVTERNAAALPDFQACIGGPKVAVSGSDAHSFSDYGKYPSATTRTWLKADPTFVGLRQVLCDPAERCFIGEKPELLHRADATPSSFMDRLSITKAEDSALDEAWFDGVSLSLNPGLVAVIGNKGSGKSALVDILANLSGSKAPAMSFLTKERFRQPRTNFASHFSASLRWADGREATRSLAADPLPGEPLCARYITQGYLEKLCNALTRNERGELEETLDKIVFEHTAPHIRQNSNTFHELVEARSRLEQVEEDSLRRELAGLNGRISGIEEQLTTSSIASLKRTLAARKEELLRLNAAKPKNVVNPAAPMQDVTDEQGAAQHASRKVLAELKNEMAALEAGVAGYREAHHRTRERRDDLHTTLVHAEQLKREVDRQLGPIADALQGHGILISDVFTLASNFAPIREAIASYEEQMTSLEPLFSDSSKLFADLAVARERARTTRETLDEGERRYQEYLEAVRDWEGRVSALKGDGDPPPQNSIAQLEQRVEWLEGDASSELDRLRVARRIAAGRVFASFEARRAHLKELYAPVQDRLDTVNIGVDLGIQLTVNVGTGRFVRGLSAFVNFGRKGAFHGTEDGTRKMHELLDGHDLTSWNGVCGLLDAVELALQMPQTEGGAVSDQFVQGVSVAEVYNFVFGLQWLELVYGIVFDSKSLTALSPGERGVVLLVFYLLADTSNEPLIIDQPELNLDSESIVRLLVPCVKMMRRQRQIIIVTHSPNLAVVCDADQVVVARLNRSSGNTVSYVSGGIEDATINRALVDVLEGTWPAIDNRYPKYSRIV